MDINLNAAFYMTKYTLPIMRKNKWGRIINIASLQSLRAFDNSIPYGASKGGVMQLTRALAQAYSKDGVLVNAIAPGFIKTEMTEVLDPKVVEGWVKDIPLQRAGEGDDIAELALFLASDNSTYITGQVINVCGGMSM